MEQLSQGEAHPIHKEQIARMESEGADIPYIKTSQAHQMMRGIEGMIIMKDAYERGGAGGSPQHYGNAPEGATVGSEREIGAKALRRWTSKLPSDKRGEFYELLKGLEIKYKGRQEDVDEEGRNQYGYQNHYDKLRDFLGENITYHGKMKSQKIRRTAEDKIMNGFMQQDNKYNMGK